METAKRSPGDLWGKIRLLHKLSALLLLFGAPVYAANPAPDLQLAPLALQLPLPSLSKNGPDGMPQGPQIEAVPDRPRPTFLVPKGVTNVAFGKTPTCSDSKPRRGLLLQITDGKKEAFEDQLVELHKGLQWVQIDLAQEQQIFAVVLWHDHIGWKRFHDVIVQVANDPDFKINVRTLFNNDDDNSAGFGRGNDKEYYEIHEGKLIDTKGIKARYLRFYSNGYEDYRQCDDIAANANAYQEIEIYALPLMQANAAAASVVNLVPLPVKWPRPSMSVNGPGPIYEGPHVERGPMIVPTRFNAPQGVTNVAFGKKVTSSCTNILTGSLEQITDGLKEDDEGHVVMLSKGRQWVQIDLGAEQEVYAIVVWHDITGLKYFCDVVVQVSNDPDFLTNVQTLFNNDWNDTSGLGFGNDKEYYDGWFGKVVDAKGIKTRYVRLYSNGYQDAKGVGDKVVFDPTNRYEEIEVYALPNNVPPRGSP